MTKLVPINSSSHALMVTRLFNVQPRAVLHQNREGTSGTFVLTRSLAALADLDDLAAILDYAAGNEPAVLALCGGPRGPAFKGHPKERKVQYDVLEEGLVAKLIDLRFSRTEPLIALFDPNLTPLAASFCSMAEQLPEFGGADILYVADANEVDPSTVAQFRDAKLRTVIVQKSSTKTAFGTASYIVFPAIPQGVRDQYMLGEQPLRQLMRSASPGARIMFEVDVARFLNELVEAIDG